MTSPPPGDDIRIWTGPPSVATRMSYAVVRGAFVLVFKVVGRTQVIGRENIPASGAFVLAPVHRSNIDFALSSLVTDRPMRFMGKDSIWKIRILGRFVSLLGAFPVHRGSTDRDAMKACLDIVDGGNPLVMFPEGTRNEGPVIFELFDGTAYVAAKCGVPIVPMGIGGSELALAKGSRRLHRSPLVIVVGSPIPPPAKTPGGRVPRSAVSALTARLRTELQACFDDALARVAETQR